MVDGGNAIVYSNLSIIIIPSDTPCSVSAAFQSVLSLNTYIVKMNKIVQHFNISTSAVNRVS